MSLRFRLFLGFAVLVALLFVVGVTSAVTSRQISTHVADLRLSHGLDLRQLDFDKVGLEFEGHWDDAGSFVATDAEVLPATRQPKLRGALQRVDPARGALTMYGVTVGVTPATEFVAMGHEASGLQGLRSGQRVEISCSVQGDRWTARKIKTRDVKSSDKIKGTVTSAELDGRPPETVEVHGLVISLAPMRNEAAQGAVRRIKLATRMALALQDCRAFAHELIGRPHSASQLELEIDSEQASSVSQNLERAEQAFEHYLEQALDRGGSSTPVSDASSRLLRPLSSRRRALHGAIESLCQLASADLPSALALLDTVLDPLIEDELLPPVHAYLSDAEETLGDQLRAISSRTATTARVAQSISAAALFLATVLGFLLWRSIHRPVRALHRAALRIGQGHLDTRVGFESKDEFGVLADAFDEMASRIRSTTVSVNEHERAEEQLRRSLAEKEILLRDVHHRVKNNMQVISSLLAMQAGSSEDPRAHEMFAMGQSRIRSMALIHEQLYSESSDLARIDVRAYLLALTTHLSQSLDASGSIEIEVGVEGMALDVDQSLACGLIVNELVTNAFKHAFSCAGLGVIRVSLREDAIGMRCLEVADDGVGMSERLDPQRSETLGLSLVATLARQLGGEVSVAGDGGTVVRVMFPQLVSEQAVVT